MDSEKLSSMYAEILNGKAKEQSRSVTDVESSGLWDKITGEVQAIRREDPRAHFSVPNEWPDADPIPPPKP